jgi:hypothetical protein
MEVRLGHGAGVRAFWDDLLFAATPSPPDAATPRLEARYTPRLSVGGAELRPFVRYAETGRAEGWTLGLEGRYPWAFREGPWSLGLDPAFLLALYPGQDPYLSLGGSLRAGYKEGDLRAELGYWARWEPFGPRNRFAFDSPNPEFQRLRSVLIDAQAEEARLSARRAALLARLAQVEARIGLLKDRVARAQMEQETVNQALELAKNAYLALAQKRTDLQIQIASNQEAWASVLAPAYPVYEKVAPRRGLLLALAVVLGLMLGVMAAFVAEALRPKEGPVPA